MYLALLVSRRTFRFLFSKGGSCNNGFKLLSYIAAIFCFYFNWQLPQHTYIRSDAVQLGRMIEVCCLQRQHKRCWQTCLPKRRYFNTKLRGITFRKTVRVIITVVVIIIIIIILLFIDIKIIYRRNRPWRPIGLWDVKNPTLSRQLAQRWR
jgi:hypothetical protein